MGVYHANLRCYKNQLITRVGHDHFWVPAVTFSGKYLNSLKHIGKGVFSQIFVEKIYPETWVNNPISLMMILLIDLIVSSFPLLGWSNATGIMMHGTHFFHAIKLDAKM